MRILTPDAFDRPTVEVARDLLGCLLVHAPEDGPRLAGRVVETEAYTWDDPACHGYHLADQATGELVRQGRGADLFAAPGMSYVYLCYGVYWLLNVVTEAEGVGGAVLIRAVEPTEGLDLMRSRRPRVRRDRDLTNGPGKLTLAFGIDGALHKIDMTAPPLYFARPEESPPEPIATSTRIGITKGAERPWRFFLDGNRFVSRGPKSA